MIARTLGILAAASLVGAGGVAAAQTAAPLSLANAPGMARAGAVGEEENALRGSARWIVGAVVLALVVWGAIELLDDGEEDFPVSP
jgi:hypothetical protein